MVELLTTLGFHQANVASPAENDEEKRLRKQATQDFKFFTAVNTAFKEFNATQREHEQVKILVPMCLFIVISHCLLSLRVARAVRAAGGAQ